MKKYSKEELAEILQKHNLWLQGDPEGKRADLYGSDLSYSNLSGSDLSYSNLSGSNLSGSNLSGSNLYGSDLRGSNLSGSDLCGSNLGNISSNEQTAGYALACPEKGAYIAFKKASGYIVELEIPADAQRSSATTRKCRASKAKVLSITTLEGNEGPKAVYSSYDPSFAYQVGETVEVTNFDTDRWRECSTGIHHFITRDEAVKY